MRAPDPVKRLCSHRASKPHEPHGSAALDRDREATIARIDPSDGRFLASRPGEGVRRTLHVVEVEHLEAKVHGGREITPYALRVTMIFRPEEGAWKVVHRHADQISTPQPTETVAQR